MEIALIIAASLLGLGITLIGISSIIESVRIDSREVRYKDKK